MSNFTSADILKALSHVEDPDLKKDLVTLGMIKQLTFDEKHISFTLELTTPACPMKDMLENACRNAIQHFVSKEVEININITSRTTSGNNSPLLPKVKNIIAVGSGKGGVGKSSVSTWLALTLAKSGAKVGLLDGDIYGPSIPTMMGVKDYRPSSREKNGKTLLEPCMVNGIKVFSIGFLADDRQAIVWRGPMLSKAFKQFVEEVDWDELDYLIIDLPPGTGDIQLTICQTLPLTGVVVVTTPQNVSLADAQRAISMFDIQGIQFPVLGVVENMAYFIPPDDSSKKYAIFGEGGGQKLAENNNIDLLGQIPINMSLREAADAGINENNIPSMQFFADIAGNIVRKIAILNNKNNHGSAGQN